MKKIDTTSWKEFRVGDLFDIHPTKAYKLTNVQLLDGGKTPVVVNSAYNNGIGGYSTLEATEKGNMITFSDTVDANTIFYQKEDFVGYPHVQGMYPIGDFKDKWAPYSLMYFASLFRKTAVSKGFDYGNKFRRDIAIDIRLKLPSKDNEPDWQYMEDYMRLVEQRVKCSTFALKYIKNTRLEIDHSNWKEFELNSIFDIVLSKGDIQAKKMNEGDIPLVSSGKFNNGICKYIAEGDGKAEMFDANIITTDMFGKSYYQPKPFFAVSHGRVNMLIPRFKLNIYTAKFLVSVLDASFLSKYSFSGMCCQKELLKEKILLPARGDAPDWHYMEMYMRGVEAIVKNKLSLLVPHKSEDAINDAANVTFNNANVTYIDNSKTYNVEK